MTSLGVNIDHVATLRQARYRAMPDSPNAEPDPVAAALQAEAGGAHGITVHLRADRRHIQDRDVLRLRESISTKLNLEMGHHAEILRMALRIQPDDVCMVPEERQEITTEGGLDCVGLSARLAPTVKELINAGIRVSLFIDPEREQVEAAARLGAQFIELHTGAYANALGAARGRELQRLEEAARVAGELGLRVNAGHGLNYENVRGVLRLAGLEELNIGHSIVARAVGIGMVAAVREMVALLEAETKEPA